KRAEEALRESERSLHSVIDGIPGQVAVLAPNGDLEAVNHQIVEYSGRSPEKLKNWGTNGTVHPDDPERLPLSTAASRMVIASSPSMALLPQMKGCSPKLPST